ncbi:uncharacterized protein LOC128726407 [Anopheles nili]|uniref:uncharacterized protein LOC128726407 n=1 Tax=Anopheles nili TaxID=185578 RepID=UPI00237B94ED|nr:uncharacterized protein LOC128726407 [Anopheles nili]
MAFIMDEITLLIVTALFFVLLGVVVNLCCRMRRNEGSVIATPVTISTNVPQVGTGVPQTVYSPLPVGTIVQGHMTRTVAYPGMPMVYQSGQPQLIILQQNPLQGYVQHYSLQQSTAPVTAMPNVSPVKHPAMPS